MISITFVRKGSINCKQTLLQAMAWYRTGDKPLPKPVVITDAQIRDAYMRHQASMS